MERSMTAQVIRIDFRPYAVRRREEIINSYAPFGAEFERGLRDSRLPSG
jgi:hypothetical protein